MYMRHITLVLLLCLCLYSVGSADSVPSANPYYSIEKAYQDGKIDKNEKLLEQMRYFFAPAKMASRFATASAEPLKSGTELILEVRANWDSFSKDQQAELSSYLSRPSLANEMVSTSGFFRIHYEISGPEAVPVADTNGNSIPDYVERAAMYCDSAHSMYTNQFGYFDPPSDDTVGGDEKYDIYLMAIPAYGVTYSSAAGDSAWDDYSSFIGIYYDFFNFELPPNDDPEGLAIGALKVTCAHEFFHATQLAYDLNEQLWWMEATATWMEEVVFPGVNDNYSYLPYYLGDTETSLTNDNGYHKYGAFLWPAFLQHRYGPSLLVDIWERCRYQSVLAATDGAIHAANSQSSLTDEFLEFTVWNYYTGSRAIPGEYYEEAAAYPEVGFDQSFETMYHTGVVPVTLLDALGYQYVRFTIDPSATGIMELKQTGSAVQWGASAIVSDGVTDSIYHGVGSSFPIKFIHDAIENQTSIVAIPTVVSTSGGDKTYSLDCITLPYGDINYDYTVNVGDATYVVNYIFKGGPAPKPYFVSGDANCDGQVNIADAVYVINYIFKGGTAPCYEP